MQRDPSLMQSPPCTKQGRPGGRAQLQVWTSGTSHMLGGFGEVTFPLSLGSPGQMWKVEEQMAQGASSSPLIIFAGPFQGMTQRLSYPEVSSGLLCQRFAPEPRIQP